MRACARVALASIAVSASFNLSGCAAIEELKETFLRWVESEKLPSGRAVSADELPEATPVVPPKETPEVSRCARRSGICTISYCVPGY
jgi:hypothetical protein